MLYAGIYIIYLWVKWSLNEEGKNVDVELEKIVLGPATSSTPFQTFFFNSRFSGTHSWTNNALLTASSNLIVPKK